MAKINVVYLHLTFLRQGQVCFAMHLYGKNFKHLVLQNRGCLMAESLHISSETGGLPKLLK